MLGELEHNLVVMNEFDFDVNLFLKVEEKTKTENHKHFQIII